MDSHIMEKIFSNKHSLSNLPSYSEENSEEAIEKLESVLDQMGRISPVEADMIELHILKGVPQSSLGKIFGYTQPNIHYRVNRAMERLKVLLTIPIFTEEYLQESLSRYFSDKKDIRVMILLYLYSSQSHAAREIGESQGKVRYRFLRCLSALEKIEDLRDIHQALSTVNSNLTLLRKIGCRQEKRRVLL
tara:strand:- start:1002 stop:1571 length:570 start_codon:yes stop_codon:yes gene_type:complete